MGGGGLQGGFQTTTKTMGDISTDFQSVYKDLNNRFDQLQRDMQKVRDRWKGPAGDEFQKMMNKYHEDVTTLNTALQKIATNLADNEKAYDTGQKKSVDALSQITAKLQGSQ